MSITRRELIAGSAALAAGSLVTTPFLLPKFHSDHRLKRSRFAVLHAHNTQTNSISSLAAALCPVPINIRGKTVVLKPNLVDFVLVLATAESFRCLGAKSVVVAEGLGHQRDAQLVLSQTGHEQSLRAEGIRFVDLNRDELIRTPLRASYTGMKDLCLPRTVLEADFLVSMPKIKAHHWSGVTLSIKNMFGIVPGARYGWPKNILHWKGIQENILDLCATVPIHFVIADGIVAMEGNGPLNGTARTLGKIVLADDPVAADATCSRLMGFILKESATFTRVRNSLGMLRRPSSTRLEKPLLRRPCPSRWFRNFDISRPCDALPSGCTAPASRRTHCDYNIRWPVMNFRSATPDWNFEDVGLFFLVLVLIGFVLRLLVRFPPLPRSELSNPSVFVQFLLIASLTLALYLALKLRHHRPVLHSLGWDWPRPFYVVVGLIAGVLLASGVVLYLLKL